MAEQRGRSRRVQRRRVSRQSYDPYSQPPASRPPRDSSGARSPRTSRSGSSSSSASRRRPDPGRPTSSPPPAYPGGASGALVPRSAGALSRTPSPRYQSRDGRRLPLGPDSRRRPQIGAYAPAFGGRRSPQSTPPRSGLVARQPGSPQSQLIAFPGARAAGTDRPVQRLQPRPVRPAAPPRPPRRRRIQRPTPPIVYAVRLLILGVGIGAIAGTLISALDPSRQARNLANNPSDLVAEDGLTPGSALNAMMNAPESGRSLISTLQLGQEMTTLSSEIESLINTYPDLSPGVFLYDLDTGSYINLNGSVPFSAASIIKVPVLVAFFQDVEAGKINLNDRIAIQEEDVAAGSGEMQFQAIGTEYTALETATQMIIISDNTATNMLIRLMGGPEVLNQRFRSWGLTQTAIRNLLPDLEGTNTTSPQEMVELMTLVSQSEVFSSTQLRSRDRMLRIMERTRTNTLLPQGIAPEARIAHKTGDIGSMVGDVGLIDMPNGKRYAVAVMVQRPHNDNRAQQLIRQISATIYEAFESTALPSEEETLDGSPSTGESGDPASTEDRLGDRSEPDASEGAAPATGVDALEGSGDPIELE